MARNHLGTAAAVTCAAIGAAALLACQDEPAGARRDRTDEAVAEDARHQNFAPPAPSPQAGAQGGRAEVPSTAQGGEGPATAPREKPDLRAQPGEAKPGPDTIVSGRVVRATEQEIVLRYGPARAEMRLALGPRTPVLRGGERVSTAALREGTQVRVAYTIPEGGAPSATRIEIGPAE